MEFNSRVGDPEALNIMYLLDTPFVEVAEAVIYERLTKDNCKFKNMASMVVYLVSKEYALKGGGQTVHFSLDVNQPTKEGGHVNFSSCEHLRGNEFVSVGSSRLVGLVTLGETLESARDKIYDVIRTYAPANLDYRTDIGITPKNK